MKITTGAVNDMKRLLSGGALLSLLAMGSQQAHASTAGTQPTHFDTLMVAPVGQDYFDQLEDFLMQEKDRLMPQTQKVLSEKYKLKQEIADPICFYVNRRDSTVTFFCGLSLDTLWEEETIELLQRADPEKLKGGTRPYLLTHSPGPYSDSLFSFYERLVEQPLLGSGLRITWHYVYHTAPRFNTVSWYLEKVFDVPNEDSLRSFIAREKIPLMNARITFIIDKN